MDERFFGRVVIATAVGKGHFRIVAKVSVRARAGFVKRVSIAFDAGSVKGLL